MSDLLPDARWVDVKGVRTRYYDVGEGEAVVLVHGGIAGELNLKRSADDWANNIADLSDGCRVIALDRIGQGWTDNPKTDAAWGIEGSLSHLAGFMDALGLREGHVVGHDSGGFLASSLCCLRPDLVASCTIVGSAEACPGNDRTDLVTALNPYPDGSREAREFILRAISACAISNEEEWLSVMEDIAEGELARSAAARMGDRGGLVTVYLPSLLEARERMLASIAHGSVQRPVMLAWGYDDPIAPVSQALQLFRLIGERQHRTYIHLFNKCGNLVFRERCAEFNIAIKEFVAGVSNGD